MHIISSKSLSLSDLRTLIFEGSKIKLSSEVIQKIQECREYLDQKTATTSEPIYGINTGFGALCDVRIQSDALFYVISPVSVRLEERQRSFCKS